MAGSVNKVILIGNLGQDPEIRSFPSGGKVANLRLATSETWRDKNTGERRERTEWHSVAIYSEPLVRVAEQYLRKGAKIYVEGQLETRKWQDQSGNDRYTTEVALPNAARVAGLLSLGFWTVVVVCGRVALSWSHGHVRARRRASSRRRAALGAATRGAQDRFPAVAHSTIF